MNAWQPLASSEVESTWEFFYSEFAFRPSATEFPGIREPEASVTFDISRVYGDTEHYKRLTMDLSRKLVAALRRCVPQGGVVHVLDWQHACFRFMPHADFTFESEVDWPVPALPNGDYYIFLDPSLQFGVFGHPWEQTMCIFGEALVAAFRADPPLLFEYPMRVGGRVVQSADAAEGSSGRA
jgi:hypothetical protein